MNIKVEISSRNQLSPYTQHPLQKHVKMLLETMSSCV